MSAFDPTLGERIAVIPNGLPFSLNAPARGPTDYRAIPDLWSTARQGYLSSQIAKAVQRILSQPDQYEAMSQAAVDRYEKFYMVQRHLETIVPLLKETKRRDWKMNS